MNGVRVAAIALLAAMVVSGQSLGVQRLEEPTASPTTKPLPRRFVGVHPVTIFSGLLSSSEEQRKIALQQLGEEYMYATEPIQARLAAVNLDPDPELEYVLIATGATHLSMAYVFDQDDRGWWVAGEFPYGYHWNPNEAERFVELREIVWYGRKDIVVRDTGGGTGILETSLSIYRMHNGLLYRIFETTEDREASILGTSMTEHEHRDISFPEHYTGDPAFLVSRYQKRTEFAEHARPDRKISSCSAFRWDAVSFVFVEDKAAAKFQCAAK